jgi:tetratricopeptide (TPR) repeat protein
MEVLGMLQQVLAVSLIAAIAATPPALSQGIRQGSCAECSKVVTAQAVKVLVATPYPSNASDSVSGVALGGGIRDKLAKNISGDWSVITRRDMNTNLVNWGYNPDALLPEDQARVMASKLTARVVVTTGLSKTAGSQYTANTRMVGISDDAGHVVRLTQASGQQLPDFGGKIADQLTIMFKAYADGKVCNDQQVTNKAKAIEAANKALKLIPNYGYAEYCLGLIELAKDSASPAALQHFKNALIGDPMSLQAVGRVATIDLRKGDSAAVVADFQQMITIAPTDRGLAERAINVFKQFNRPDAAEQVVNQQIKLDPYNPDWLDLKGNSCAAQGAGETDSAKARLKFDCAYSAFEQEYTLDPTRGDSLLFQKIVFVAGKQADSLTWARRYVQKYPSSIDALKLEAQMFVAAGNLDSAIVIANMIVKLDSTETKPVLSVAQEMLKQHHEADALKLIPVIQKNGDETAKNQFAGLLINALQPLANQTPRPDSMLIALGQGVIDLAPTAPNYLIYGNYFLAVGLADGLGPMASTLRASKTCEAAKAEDALLTRLEPALNVAATSPTEGIATFAKNLLGNLPPEKAFVAGMIKEKCTP